MKKSNSFHVVCLQLVRQLDAVGAAPYSICLARCCRAPGGLHLGLLQGGAQAYCVDTMRQTGNVSMAKGSGKGGPGEKGGSSGWGGWGGWKGNQSQSGWGSQTQQSQSGWGSQTQQSQSGWGSAGRGFPAPAAPAGPAASAAAEEQEEEDYQQQQQHEEEQQQGQDWSAWYGKSTVDTSDPWSMDD